MSGGYYDYAYQKVEEMARTLRGKDPLRAAFAKHLLLVAEAMHDIEWVDSGDCAKGDEIAAINAVLKPGALLEELIEQGTKIRDAIDAQLVEATKKATA